MKETPVTFEDLAALRQVSRTPCGKQAFSLSQARSAATVRSTLTGAAWYVHVCYQGCGREIFHLTPRPPGTGKGRRFNQLPGTGKRARKKARYRKNQQMYQIMSIGTWEGEGGSLAPQDEGNTP